MTSSDLPGGGTLAALLTQTAEAHHRAFSATDGVDPDWPSWYAKYLLDHGVGAFLEGSPSAHGVTESLIDADRKHRSDGEPQPWEDYYARILRGTT